MFSLLNRKLYKVKAKFKETKRFRTISLWARNENEIPAKLEQMNFEPAKTITEATPMPTEKQVELATNLGYKISPDMTRLDVKAIIDQKLNRDGYPPKYELMVFADNHDIVYSTYMGKKTMYNTVFNGLPELDRYAFFIFCVYRHLSDDREANLDKSPYKNIFYNFANFCMTDSRMALSLANYAGEDLRFFGTLRSGYNEYHGGSTQTTIYRTAKQYLIDTNVIAPNTENNKKLPALKATANYSDSNTQSNPQPNSAIYNNNSINTKDLTNETIDNVSANPQESNFTKYITYAFIGLILYWIFG